ncbi:hypothetical protein DA83_03705 [Pseudomonas sp. 250J]|nr:hypothetical protein DA83_03705 [Pseudomonas sp. 250J]
MNARGENEMDQVNSQMRAIATATSLVELDKILNQGIARQQSQALLKEDVAGQILARVEEQA